jgi:hypothetical protein
MTFQLSINPHDFGTPKFGAALGAGRGVARRNQWLKAGLADCTNFKLMLDGSRNSKVGVGANSFTQHTPQYVKAALS